MLLTNRQTNATKHLTSFCQGSNYDDTVELYYGITHGKVLKGGLYTLKIQKIIYLHLFTELFCEDFSSIVGTNPDL